MDNSIYVSTSRQQILARQMDIVANNIANADTPGFKVEDLIAGSDPKTLPGGAAGARPLQFVTDTGVARDFSQGSLSQTGRPFDLAINGQGFFQVTTANGPRYTRDGSFQLDATGQLVTAAGDPVDGGGGPIVLDPSKGEPMISADGAVSQGANQVGKISVYTFPSLSALAKDGDGLYQNVGNQSPIAAPSAKLVQGSIEASNVNSVVEVTRMIEVSREYERVSNMMDSTNQLNSEAIQRLGKVN